ncbi:MAG: type IIA DNA topoisomerase subunit B [Oligoflexia bacterium]|nr:type IIA DNA topoisomerase subunit B [Oligoflexia bacterium]
MAKASTYSAADIEVLEGLEPVRKRPGMYIGGTEGPAGLHHLVKEILDNSVDEAMNGHADEISVTLHKDGESITVKDNGRGIPVDMHPKFKKPALEIILTTLHSGGKFSDHNYVSAGGLHGVGSSVVNALSEQLVATIWRDGYEWEQSFSRGKAASKMSRGAKTKEHGTQIHFRPDSEIFRSIKFSADRLERMLEEKAFLNKGLKLTLILEASGEKKLFCFEDGLKSYLGSLLEKQGNKPIAEEMFYLERANGIKVEVAFCWTESTQEKVLSYVNGIFTAQGGSHEDGFKGGLSKALRNYMSVHDLVPKGVKVVGEDLREGLIAVLSVNVPGAVTQLQFQGQTKDRLNNPEITDPVESLLRSFENTLNTKPNVASQLVERVLLAAKARAAARSAAEGISRKVGVSHRLNLPGKLADCSSNRQDKCELFIVEGDSAGGSAKQGRDRETQAVLPLRGKILNAISAGEGKLKDNKELIDLVSALGCGIGEQLKLNKLRYGKVIILTDADADGMHISSLLMAFFFRFMRPLIESGHLYIGMPPLYRIRLGSGSKEDTRWVYSDEQKEKVLKESGRAKVAITRFKGLGEMNPDTLWETTLSPRTRSLLRVTFSNAQEAAAMFDSLLGKDAGERYRLIQENAHRLELDV